MITLDKRLTWTERGRLWFRLSIRLILAILIVVLAMNFGKQLISLFMPFILALLVAMALNPTIQKIQVRHGFKRSKITIVLIVSLFIVSVIIAWILLNSIATEVFELLNGWEDLFIGFQNSLAEIEAFAQKMIIKFNLTVDIPDHGILDSITAMIFDYLKELTSDVSGLTAFARDRVVAITSFGVSLLIFLMACYFITDEYPSICSRFTGRIGENLTKLLNQIKAITVAAFGGYIKARAIVATGVAIIIFIGFLITKQEYALIISIIMGILDFIPIIGSGTVLVPWSIIAFITGSYGKGAELLIIYGVVTVFRNIAEPKLVGDKTGLSPTLSLITIYIGMRLGGVVGMILGPVLTMVVINSLKIGVLKDTREDIRMAVIDIIDILHNKWDSNAKET